MYNWAVDTTQLKKQKQTYDIWKLEQMVNFGLNKERLNKKKLKTYWPLLRLDAKKRRYLSFLLWGRKKS